MKRWLLLAGPLVLLSVWSLTAYCGWVSPLFVPSFWSVISALATGVFRGFFLTDLAYTVTRVIIAVGCAISIGVPIGVLLGLSDRFYRSLEILFDFFRSVPATALMPLFLLFFGIQEGGKIAVAVWAGSFVIIVNTMYGVQRIASATAMYAHTVGATKWQEITKIIVPAGCPAIFVGIRTTISLSMIYIVMAEMFMGSAKGLGSRIYDAGIISDTPAMYAGILLVGLTGYAINKIFVSLEKQLVHWVGK